MSAHIATLFTQDEHGRLMCVNEPDGGQAPRFFLGRTRHGCESRVRDDLVDSDVLDALTSACSDEPPLEDVPGPAPAPTRYEALLARSGPIQRVWAGPAFHFPPHLIPSPRAVPVTAANAEVLRTHLASWLPDVAIGRPLFAVMAGGHAVAICGSARTTAVAHEAGVETAPAFRGCGYATEAVAAWAMAVRDLGVTPLYSTSWQNHASRALARRLGLRLFGADLHIT
ncbi:MAG: GNAT family N-acetyltransferase [Gemmatimonadaceae bacterium]